jgi:hypothetical protein
MVLALTMAGCAVEASPSEQAARETQQALSSFGLWSYGCTSSCQYKLMKASEGASQATCFLAGVSGTLYERSSYAEVSVTKSGGDWGIQIVTNGSQPLGGTAVCISTGSAVPQTFSWHNGDPELNIGSGLTRRCFLSGVRNTLGFYSNSDFVQVRKVGTTWYLGGQQGSVDDPSLFVTAFATCVDVARAAADVPLLVTNTTQSVPLASSTLATWACGLKKLGGNFTYNQFSSGAWISYDGSSSQWQLNAAYNKNVVAGCVQ